MKSLLEKNKNDDGFLQMSAETNNGTKFNAICSQDKKVDDQCYIAKYSKTDKIAGFIVFGENEGMFSIDSLGVDKDFRQGLHSETLPKRVGSSLLLIATNEMMTKAKKVGVMISDDSSGEFYKKCGFIVDKEDADVMWLSKKNYINFEENFIKKSTVTKSENAPKPS